LVEVVVVGACTDVVAGLVVVVMAAGAVADTDEEADVVVTADFNVVDTFPDPSPTLPQLVLLLPLTALLPTLLKLPPLLTKLA
jgi:hypothetical protein